MTKAVSALSVARIVNPIDEVAGFFAGNATRSPPYIA
jgi:hypothetical protein